VKSTPFQMRRSEESQENTPTDVGGEK
jgi:hypothetical protein